MPEKNTLPNKERMKIARTHMPEQDPEFAAATLKK